MELQDSTNQTTFSNSGAVHWLSSLEGFIDSGERAAYLLIANEVRNQPILDLGVGTGRTTPLLRALSTDYVAIDYLPIMVASAVHKYPSVDIQLGDARDLSRFPDESFALVVFSHAGIDAVDHAGRQRVLAEVSRVLKPQGFFWFSTLNKEGHTPHERPWREYPDRLRSSHTLRARLSVTREFLEGIYNYRRLKHLTREGHGWLIAPFSAHAYGLLTHYITLPCECDELMQAGFERDVIAFDTNGNLLDKSSDLQRVDFFNLIARKLPRLRKPAEFPVTSEAAIPTP